MIHPTAVVDPAAKIGSGVEIGPFAVIAAEVEIGDGTVVGAGVQVQGPTRIGARNRLLGPSSIGFPPQDLSYRGEPTRLEIGDDNEIREFVTISRGTKKDKGVTRIGSGNLIMAYSHIAHDCEVGSHTIFANAATLAGHVQIGDHATVGAHSAVHQFCRVGPQAYIGGFTVATQDVLPFVKTVGTRDTKTYGVNTIGLERQGFTSDRIEALQKAYRLLVRSKLPLQAALDQIRAAYPSQPDVALLLAFVEGCGKRGFVR